ncbi:ATP-dependent RecD-like DNA helicase [Streptococcus sp. NLN64]|uniref:SF1B family DNA helicase RecD2 n=1 Tax=Streptococcus sp. NLN64 TaxID=2822799 RepID=UPI0018CAFA95|nr:ATP-dependent RecD-like DNA helicase [Streptococcus sp. NLN64]MBG9367529.1 ATP-dependent RecD-like DNA helicase [Streptococcus sp. NLN64]
MEHYFSGRVERIIFENQNNYFKILLVDLDETDSDYSASEVIITGTFATIVEGSSYRFYGQLVQHPRYGEQVNTSRYEREKPSPQGLVKFFSGPQFKGVGQQTAKRILEIYSSENPIDEILNHPEKLEGIKGLSKANRLALVQTLKVNYGLEQALAKLADLGIPNRLAVEIYDTYQESTLTVIKDNPYQMVEDIRGVGFVIADQVAERLGIETNSPERFRAGIIHSLFQHSLESGDTYLEAAPLLEKTLVLLEEARQESIDPQVIATELTHLLEEDKIQHVDTKIFSNSLFFAEEGIANHLLRLLEARDQNTDKKTDAATIQELITQIEEELAITYDPVQKEAILQAIQQPIFILSGGPGTGKTTVLNGIIAVYAKLHKIDLKAKDLPIMLAAPTGRAARRMNELTGLPSATIHRHLGMVADEEVSTRDEALDTDFLIVDEFSMVDTWLAHQLFQNLANHTKILLVGDADQLPSVSPGQVLADLQEVEAIPKIQLEKIYRQDAESTIVHLANDIKHGRLPHDFQEKKADRSYFETGPEHIPQLIERIVNAALRSGIAAKDIQVLAPMYRGHAGIDAINQLMQNLLNPLKNKQQAFDGPEGQYRLGDKVIHLVNDAEANVFNGDLGTITELIPAAYSDSDQDEIRMDFDGSEVTYPRKEWYKIRLAYAMSIHKSQGSEFPVVILPLTMANRRMLQRNLLYTAITRAKSKLILLGQSTAYAYSVENLGTQRQTYLSQRFSTIYPQDIHSAVENSTGTVEEESITLEASILTNGNWDQIDPMIGLTEADLTEFFQPIFERTET